MTYFDLNSVISIKTEKQLQSKPSKGRNQWMLLKAFNGKTVGEFIDRAISSTRSAPEGTYQGGNWWDRELKWNLERGNIELKQGSRAPVTLPSEQRLTSRKGMPTQESGLYVVTLNNLNPISANAHDSRIADTSVKVNRDNIKFGKARTLSGRRNNYFKTFGESNVNYVPIALVSPNKLQLAERLIADKLRHYRIRGPSGRITEWMSGITKQEVIDAAISSLEDHGISYEKLCRPNGGD